MPSFTFEKIAPPDERKPATPTENDKPRGAVVEPRRNRERHIAV